MKRPSYKAAVQWIADNDEPTIRTMERLGEAADLISVMLVADMWGTTASSVAADVIRKRIAEDKAAK